METAAGSNAVSVGYLQQSHDAATFTARVDAINPSSVKRGGTVPAVITGVGLAETTELVFSGTGVVATISGPVTDTSVPVLINVFQNEKNAPGDSTPVVLGDRGFTLFAAIGPVTNPPEVVLRIEKSGNTFGQSQPSSTLAEVAGPTSRYGGPVERLSAAVTCRRRGILRTRRPQLASRGLPQAGTRLM